MPDYSVYAQILRPGKRKAHKFKIVVVLTVYEDRIVDWSDLKNNVLLVAARHIWQDYQQETAVVSVEKHLAGRGFQGVTSYRRYKVHYNREPQFRARITYLKNQNDVKIEAPVFITPEFYDFKADYDLERGKKWQPQPVVPKGFEATLNNRDVNLLFQDLLTLKTVSYAGLPRNSYASMQEQRHQAGSYAPIPRNSYAATNWKTVDSDKAEREKEI
ncbi:MAG: hypothetical protein ABSC20_08180 [Candidatus Bathyarchaeia archaeon]|jgi:hypothetical protein